MMGENPLRERTGSRLHGFLTSLLIALTNNFDNIGVRIAYSVRGVKIGLPQNLLIALITFVISTAAAMLGSALGNVAGPLCHVLSMAVLTAIGLWFIAEPYVKKLRQAHRPPKGKKDERPVIGALRDPEKSDIDNSKTIDFGEAALLGVSLSINNVGGGLSAGMIGLDPAVMGALSAAISFLALLLGNFAAGAFVRLGLARKTGVAAGLILIAIGVRQLF